MGACALVGRPDKEGCQGTHAARERAAGAGVELGRLVLWASEASKHYGKNSRAAAAHEPLFVSPLVTQQGRRGKELTCSG